MLGSLMVTHRRRRPQVLDTRRVTYEASLMALMADIRSGAYHGEFDV